MNFTTQRFLSPSICEYPTLEGDLSSSKERPEAKPIIGVKRSLSDFQKAQDQEKWPRNYEVMIQSPKPVKPVLHLPQLEANRRYSRSPGGVLKVHTMHQQQLDQEDPHLLQLALFGVS
ncbi:unnamed protein product, partial [Brassica rapa]